MFRVILFFITSFMAGFADAQQLSVPRVIKKRYFDVPRQGKPLPPEATIYRAGHKGDSVSFVKADFDLDLDGHPQAYHPKDIGIEYLQNAGGNPPSPNVVAYHNNKPVLQKANEAAPGYYVCMTSLKITGYADTLQKRYVHPDSVAYFVGNKWMGIAGDYGLVYNIKTKKYSYSIYADGNNGIVGEGSVKLADSLGIPHATNRRGKIVGGTDSADVIYISFLRSGKARDRVVVPSFLTEEYIASACEKLAQKFGGTAALIAQVLKFYHIE